MGTIKTTALSEIGAGNKWLRSTRMAYLYTENLYYYAENVGTMAYIPSRLYYANGKYYLSWYKPPGSPTNYDGMVCTYNKITLSESTLIRQGTDGDDDGHNYTSVIVDDNGYIYGIRNTSDDLKEVKIVKSNNPYDISAYTEIQTFTDGVDGVELDGHSYACFQKIGTDIFLILRDDRGGYRVHKKGLLDELFNNGYWVFDVTEKSYKCLLRNTSEDKIAMTPMVREQIGSYTYRLLGYIESSDGIIWFNASHTWSKNISTNGNITEAEIIANCIIEYNANANEDHWMATDGLFINGVPYILVEEGYATDPAVVLSIDYSDINIRYWDGEWKKKSIPALITGVPYNYSYGNRQLYHFSHNGSLFVLFVLASDFKSIKKYTSVDLDSWVLAGMLANDNFLFGLGGSCLNRNDLAYFSFKYGDNYNVIFHEY